VSELLGIESVYFGPKCLLTSTSTSGVNNRTRWRSDLGKLRNALTASMAP
jgi:hypothetical protein